MIRFRPAVACGIVLCSLVSVLVQEAGGDEKQSTRPNIVFVLLDNVGKDWFRCYGSQEDQTPVIDQLAYTGLRFRNFYITPVCSTSRTMLLTGRYPFTTGWHTHHDAAIYGGGHLDWNREITFSRILRDAGYSTCISGKWQVNDFFDPLQKDALVKHGFEEHCIFPEGKPGLPAHKKRYADAYVIENGRRIDTTGRFGPDIFADYAIDYMRRHRDKPFLLFYPAILTHIPVTTTPLAPDESATPREKFAAMVRYADHLVGRLVGALDELGLRDNTLVFITADNGTDGGTDQGQEQSLGGRIGGHISAEGIYSLAERGINVPFVVSCPAWISQGRESDALINAADVLPTLAELAGAELPGDVAIDGHSFVPVIRAPDDREWTRPWTFTQYGTTRTIRDQRFKLYSTGQFFDLAADPLEQHDLAVNARSKPLDREAKRARGQLQGVLDSQPPDGEWPFTFRSISARRIRARQDAARRAKWIAQDRRPPEELAAFFRPPQEYRDDLGNFRSPLLFDDGSRVDSAADWPRRRQEILSTWQDTTGPWPALIEKPRVESVKITRREDITQRQIRIEIGLDRQMVDAFMLVPDGDGPFPAVIDVYYDAQTGIGLGTPGRDFAWQLAKRGFVTLSVGKPNTGVNLDDVQPFSALAYVAANAHTVLANRPEVYPDRIGIVGHSFGGKWALFASCLYDKFDCAVWSDPGIVFGNRDDLVELHALMAPRPFLLSGGTADLPERWTALNHSISVNRRLGFNNRVAMTNRPTHAPTKESNEQVCRFFEWWLMERE